MRSLPRPPLPDGVEVEFLGHLDSLHDRMTSALAQVPVGKEHIYEFFKGREHWRDYKAAFEAPGRRARCGYCERFRDLHGELHVDHYRPKSVVSAWSAPPAEVSDAPPPIKRLGLGYWWLAYRWSNFVLACWTCNAAWKRTLFPVDSSTRDPLLLHPFEPFLTRAHFCWDRLGYIAGRSPKGSATIATCGLNRRELVAARLKVYQEVEEAVDQYIEAHLNGSREQFRRCERRLDLLGGVDREFVGMTRWIIEDRTKIPTAEFFDE